MTITVTTKSYSGVGVVRARPAGVAGAFVEVGNVSDIVLQHDIDTQRQPEFRRSGGGTAIRRSRIEAINAQMTWLHFSPENWALAIAGAAHTVTGATATAEPVKGYPGHFVPLLYPPLAITSVTETGADPDTFVAGDDYVRVSGGLFIPADSAITSGQDLLVTYTYSDHTRIEGAMTSSKVMELHFQGLNEADSDRPVLVNFWRMDIPPAQEVRLINRELGELSFEAELLSDPTKGTGVSAFYRALLL